MFLHSGLANNSNKAGIYMYKYIFGGQISKHFTKGW